MTSYVKDFKSYSITDRQTRLKLYTKAASLVVSYRIHQERSQRWSKGAMPPSPNRRLSGLFTEKNWLCLDVTPDLFSKVTMFSLPEVCCGPQNMPKIWGA